MGDLGISQELEIHIGSSLSVIEGCDGGGSAWKLIRQCDGIEKKNIPAR